MTSTPNINLNRPNLNTLFWHDEINENFSNIDALARSILGLELKGEWKSSTGVVAGDKYFDPVDGQYYQAESDFITTADMPQVPATFAAERIAHPARWTLLSIDTAITAASGAVESAENAAESATEAATSATNAATSAAAAANSATNSGNFANQAVTAQNATQTIADSVQGNTAAAAASATAAAASASTAQTASQTALAHRDEAATSASAASTSADNALSSAESAAREDASAAEHNRISAAHAANAAISAESALVNQENTRNDLLAASARANQAAQSAAAAAISATEAAASATEAAMAEMGENTEEAQNAATAAAESAVEAAASALNAASSLDAVRDSATDADNSATAAEASAAQVAAAVLNAQGHESAAGTSATNAATSASEAAESATEAANSATSAAASAVMAGSSETAAAASATTATQQRAGAVTAATTATQQATLAAASAEEAENAADSAQMIADSIPHGLSDNDFLKLGALTSLTSTTVHGLVNAAAAVVPFDETEHAVRFASNLTNNHIPTEGSYDSTTGDIILPEGVFIVVASMNCYVDTRNEMNANSRNIGYAGIKYDGNTLSADPIYLRNHIGGVDDTTGEPFFIYQGLVNPVALVTSDGTNAVQCIVELASQEGPNATTNVTTIRGAHIVAYRQVVGARGAGEDGAPGPPGASTAEALAAAMEAATSATNAAASASAALSSSNDASTSADDAEDSSAEALTFSTAAATSATEAAASNTAAGISETTALGSATTATTQATAAAASATSASNFATNAMNARNDSRTARNESQTARDASQASATAAATSATEAAASATAAAGAVQTGVADWAETGNTDQIPLNKLGNVPSGGGDGGSGERVPLFSLMPDAVTYDDSNSLVYTIQIDLEDETDTTVGDLLFFQFRGQLPVTNKTVNIRNGTAATTQRPVRVRRFANGSYSTSAMTTSDMYGFQYLAVQRANNAYFNVAGTQPVALTGADIDTRIESWAQEGDTSAIPADKLTNAPSSGGGGGLDQAAVDARVAAGVADWAEDGNTTQIPANKLENADARIADWAETGNNDLIPASKLTNAPGGGGGLNQAAVDARIANRVLDWAETGNTDPIPSSKLTNGGLNTSQVNSLIEPWARDGNNTDIPSNKLDNALLRTGGTLTGPLILSPNTMDDAANTAITKATLEASIANIPASMGGSGEPNGIGGRTIAVNTAGQNPLTITAADVGNFYFLDTGRTGTGDLEINLPSAVGVGAGWFVVFRKFNSGGQAVNIAAGIDDNIAGNSFYTIAAGAPANQTVAFYSDGSTTWRVNQNGVLTANAFLGDLEGFKAPRVIASGVVRFPTNQFNPVLQAGSFGISSVAFSANGSTRVNWSDSSIGTSHYTVHATADSTPFLQYANKQLASVTIQTFSGVDLTTGNTIPSHRSFDVTRFTNS